MVPVSVSGTAFTPLFDDVLKIADSASVHARYMHARYLSVLASSQERSQRIWEASGSAGDQREDKLPATPLA